MIIFINLQYEPGETTINTGLHFKCTASEEIPNVGDLFIFHKNVAYVEYEAADVIFYKSA